MSRPGARSCWADLGGPVRWVDHGGPPDGPLLVGVHGLGGSVLDWNAVAPSLTATCRFVSLDLLGFGLTRSSGRPVTVGANRLLLHRFLTEELGEPVVLVGNSMGGMICAQQAASAPATVRGVVLLDPALSQPFPPGPDPLVAAIFTIYATPFLGPLTVRTLRRNRTPRQAVMEILRLCCAEPGLIPADIVDEHVELTAQRRDFPEVAAEHVAASRSLLLELAQNRRYARTMAAIDAPVLLLHGSRDRLVRLSAARALAAAHPRWRFEIADGVGHVPMLESPDWTAAAVLGWLGDRLGRAPDHRREHPGRRTV